MTEFDFLNHVGVELAKKVMPSKQLGPDDLCGCVFVHTHVCVSEREWPTATCVSPVCHIPGMLAHSSCHWHRRTLAQVLAVSGFQPPLK